MKKLILIMMVLSVTVSEAQSDKKKVAVLNIDTKGLNYEPSSMGNLVRLELEKLNLFEVVDRYDVEYLVKKNGLDINGCFGKICLVEMGKHLRVDKMFSGSVEMIGEKIIIQFRMIDVHSESIEGSQVKEFLNLPKNLQEMISMTLNEMYQRPINKEIERELTALNDFDNYRNNPGRYRLQNDGPRMGFTVFTGQVVGTLKGSTIDGGYGLSNTTMFQFGYQFEKQYLNEGRFQALFEFIPMITGLDKRLIIPSFTLMNGIRDNKSGWEFGIGPTFNIVRLKKGYIDRNGNWYTSRIDGVELFDHQRFDSRGTPNFNTGFIIAFGKTFRSGKLNIPVNAFWIPSDSGNRFGISFGFNAKNDDRYKEL
jgi:TolB-like protein